MQKVEQKNQDKSKCSAAFVRPTHAESVVIFPSRRTIVW